MLGSIYIGLSGMNAYSSGLQTISNNVANLNTAGFKSTSVSFNDLFSSSSSFVGSSFGSSGSGVHIGSSVNFGAGDLRQTENDLDLAIDGSGFLVLLDENGNTFYTRTGQFAIDKDGYIAEQGTGKRLAVLGADGQPTAVNIDAKRTNPPVATTKIDFDGILSGDATTATEPNITIYDSRGGKHVWSVNFTRGDTIDQTTEWAVIVKDENGDTVGTSTLKFNSANIDPTTAVFTATDTIVGADALDVTLDFSSVTSPIAGTQDAEDMRAAPDGNGVGSLVNVTVDEDGQVKLTYSNEKTELVGAIAIADFRNLQELEQIGDGLLRDSGDAQARLLTSGQDGAGKVLPKRIEASNVDLAQEFGDLILIQRGFQACSQVVSVSNDMIQQLFGIRGQG